LLQIATALQTAPTPATGPCYGFHDQALQYATLHEIQPLIHFKLKSTITSRYKKFKHGTGLV
jgi:hypothetical protein